MQRKKNSSWIMASIGILSYFNVARSQATQDGLFQAEYFYQNHEVAHQFVALGVTKYYSFYNQFTFDYHYALGWDVVNNGFYIHTPAAASLGFILLQQSQGFQIGDLAVLFSLIPEGIGLWVGPESKKAHISFNIASTDFYAGFGNIEKHFDYIPNISFQQIIYDDPRFGTFFGYSSLGYDYQKKWAPQNACIRLALSYERPKKTDGYN